MNGNHEPPPPDSDPWAGILDDDEPAAATDPWEGIVKQDDEPAGETPTPPA